MDAANKVAVYNPDEHEFGLMPAPIHVGRYLRLKKIDFSLPYDIYLMHKNNMVSYT